MQQELNKYKIHHQLKDGYSEKGDQVKLIRVIFSTYNKDVLIFKSEFSP